MITLVIAIGIAMINRHSKLGINNMIVTRHPGRHPFFREAVGRRVKVNCCLRYRNSVDLGNSSNNASISRCNLCSSQSFAEMRRARSSLIFSSLGSFGDPLRAQVRPPNGVETLRMRRSQPLSALHKVETPDREPSSGSAAQLSPIRGTTSLIV